MSEAFRHRHIYTFHNFWDQNKDGILSWDDFNIIAEHYTKLQRKGKLEKDVYERWKSILEKWWNELTVHADYNKDTVVEFDEWIKFFKSLGDTTKTFTEIPDFLQKYLHLLFQIMDTNKDGLFCAKDYKKYLKANNLAMETADTDFASMLDEVDKANGNAMPIERFKQLVYEYWTKDDPNTQGKYMFGPYQSVNLQEMEGKLTKKK